MFTGIIRSLGSVSKIDQRATNAALTIATAMAKDLAEGDSLAINGVCLTVLATSGTTINFHVMQETLAKTNLGLLNQGTEVNLERPLQAGQAIDGHFVMGHIDEVAQVTSITQAGADSVFTFKPPDHLLPYLIPKGSVALDGVSLTIVDIVDDSFRVSMFPYTLEHTTFGKAKVGYKANIEVDMLGKYVERMLNRNRAVR